MKMKIVLVLLTGLLSLLSIDSAAQSVDSFDIASFNPPAGWKKQTKPGVVIYNISDQKQGSYALITVYTSGPSSGDIARDFESDWREFIAEPFGVRNKPETQPAREAAGWTNMSGGTQFQNQLGTAVVILSTYSGYGKKFSASSMFNSADYIPAIEAFASSIKLRRPEAAQVSVPTGGETNAGILGTWSAGSSGAVRSDDYKNPYSANGYGYGKSQYTFNADGTYTFLSKTFRATLDKILLVKERGTYQISGNRITISPQTSVIEAWSKRDGTDKWGRLLTSQRRALEKVTYQFTRHYFSGIQVWNLVLQAESPTERDGPFSSNTTFTNAWYYAPISPNNTAIELP